MKKILLLTFAGMGLVALGQYANPKNPLPTVVMQAPFPQCPPGGCTRPISK